MDFRGLCVRQAKKGIFDYLEETGQTHTQNKFIASLKKVFNQIETKGIE
jgi:chromosome partitioning protein